MPPEMDKSSRPLRFHKTLRGDTEKTLLLYSNNDELMITQTRRYQK